MTMSTAAQTSDTVVRNMLRYDYKAIDRHLGLEDGYTLRQIRRRRQWKARCTQRAALAELKATNQARRDVARRMGT